MSEAADLERARRRFVEINGEHPMTADDDAYVREHFVPASPESLRLMAQDLLPQASYLLSDGTPMVPETHAEPARAAGGTDRLHDWFVAFWPEDPGLAEREWAAYLSGRYTCLRRVRPISIRQRARMVAQARDATAGLREAPADTSARASLGEALDGVPGVTGLDALLLPMTGYDRRRLGGPTVRDTWVDAPRAAFLSPAPAPLPIRTDRLVLREQRPGDEEAFVGAWADEGFVRHLLDGTRNQAETRAMFLDRGEAPGDPHRTLGVVVEHDGAVVGDLVLMLQGPGLTQAEIGWTILPEHAGRGFATEGARALLAVAFGHYALHRVVAQLDERNAASAALCERLGMRLESSHRGDYWSKGEFTDSRLYALLASEWADDRH